MVRIFSYRRLHEESIQEDTFGVLFTVEDGLDLVEGYDFIYRKLEGVERRIAVFTDKKKDVIMGAIVHIPEDYIEIIDDYEGDWYKRVTIKTMSGRECELYVKKD